MIRSLLFTLLCLPITLVAQTTVMDGFLMPESVVQDQQGNIYVTEIGERDVDGDGKITKIDPQGNRSALAKGLYDPKGLVLFKDKLYVTDRDAVIEVNINDGAYGVFAGTMSFPKSPVFLNDIDVDDQGNLYVSDSGDFKSTGFIFKIKPTGEVSLVLEDQRDVVKAPNGLLIEGDKIFILDWGGEFFKANLKTNKVKKIAEGFNGGDGIAKIGKTIYLSSWLEGKIYSVVQGKVSVIQEGYEAAADIALSNNKGQLLIPDMKAGTLTIMDLQ